MSISPIVKSTKKDEVGKKNTSYTSEFKFAEEF